MPTHMRFRRVGPRTARQGPPGVRQCWGPLVRCALVRARAWTFDGASGDAFPGNVSRARCCAGCSLDRGIFRAPLRALPTHALHERPYFSESRAGLYCHQRCTGGLRRVVLAITGTTALAALGHGNLVLDRAGTGEWCRTPAPVVVRNALYARYCYGTDIAGACRPPGATSRAATCRCLTWTATQAAWQPGRVAPRLSIGRFRGYACQ